MPTLALLDGHSLAYRAFYALPTDLATPSGQVTNAVYGFTSMVIKLFAEEKPDGVAVAWDTPAETFRRAEYAEYKAQRESAPDLFTGQLPLIHEVVDTLGIPQYEVPGYEADDVIATIAARSVADGWEVLVVTGDRDAFQLIDDSVRVLYTRRGISDTVMADAAYVAERYGIGPSQYTDLAALRGDPSDNLPGVPGVGEKTATRLLQSYGSLEGLFEHLDEQTPKLRANLAEARDQVFLNRRLAQLVTDVPLEVAPDDMRRQPWNSADVKALFDALAFRTLLARLDELGLEGVRSDREVLAVEMITGMDPAAITLGAELSAIEPVWHLGALAGFMVLDGERTALFVPEEQLDAIAPALADAAVPKALHDGKPLVRELLNRGIVLGGLVFDTAIAAYLINPAERAPGLSDLAATVLGLEIGEGEGPSSSAEQGTLQFQEPSGPDLEGAARRVAGLARLVPALAEQMEARGGTELFDEIEMPLITVLARMENAGIGVDRTYLEELGESLRDRLATLEGDIYREAGEPFNINSAAQLREVLFDRLGLKPVKKTPKGVPSTDAGVLAKLADQHPVVAHLLRYRELEKLRSTYVDGLVPLIDPDGRIRARFNQTAAATGRLSSENPNLQNIPIRSEEGRTIRRAFVPAPGRQFVVADYSQIELRILAHMSGDQGLVDAFAHDEDIHTATAARVFGIPSSAVTSEQRRTAKMINFGLLYGMEAYGLAQRLEIGREEAQEHIDAYFAQFPDVQAFMKGIVAAARDTGYTTTILGRRRYLPELASSNTRERQMGERMALNAPIQGSAADVIKKAMVKLDNELREGDTRLLLQVHDELVLEVPDAAVPSAIERTRRVMEGIVPLSVPLRVDIATGANLAECKP